MVYRTRKTPILCGTSPYNALHSQYRADFTSADSSWILLSCQRGRLASETISVKKKKTVWGPDLYARLQSILTTSTTTDLEVQGDDVMSEDVEVLRFQRSPVQCYGIPTAVGRSRLGVGGLVDEVGRGG